MHTKVDSALPLCLPTEHENGILDHITNAADYNGTTNAMATSLGLQKFTTRSVPWLIAYSILHSLPEHRIYSAQLSEPFWHAPSDTLLLARSYMWNSEPFWHARTIIVSHSGTLLCTIIVSHSGTLLCTIVVSHSGTLLCTIVVSHSGTLLCTIIVSHSGTLLYVE